MEKRDKIFFGLVIFCILLLTGLVLYMKTEVAQCVKNPLVFGADMMGDVDCLCHQYTNPSCPARFSFNDTAFVSIPTLCQGIQGLTVMPRMVEIDITQE